MICVNLTRVALVNQEDTALRVVSVRPHEDARWLSFVQERPDALVYHHPTWLEVLEREFPNQGAHLLCEDGDGRVRGVLPLAWTRGLPLGLGGHLGAARLSSLPRTPVAGPLATHDDAAAALLRAAAAQAGTRPGTRLQVKVGEPSLDGMVDGLVGTPWRTTYRLRLPERPEDLRFGDSRNHGRIKWAVKKANRNGVGTRLADTHADLRSWYELYLDTMRDNFVPARPFRFFAALWDLLRPAGLMWLVLAERQAGGRSSIIAGSVILVHGETAFYAFSGRSRSHLDLRPNEVIQWQAIHDACRDGFRHYDLGEVPWGNTSLRQFKEKWANDARPLHRYYMPAVPVRDEPDREGHMAGRRQLAATWRLVPRPVTAAVGDRLHAFL